jgi:hypothetical protein
MQIGLGIWHIQSWSKGLNAEKFSENKNACAFGFEQGIKG